MKGRGLTDSGAAYLDVRQSVNVAICSHPVVTVIQVRESNLPVRKRYFLFGSEGEEGLREEGLNKRFTAFDCPQ